MADQQSPVEENPAFIVLNPDGSYTRLINYPVSLPSPDLDSDTPVLSKDVVINDINKTGVRIHIPKETLITTAKPARKLPLVVYCHGGGFVLMSAATTVVHEFCNQLAAQLHVVVVSVEYRLAPEHRLPAAYDDAMEALHWIKSTQDPWLTDFADLHNCYLMGTSAGANMTYHAGLRVSQRVHDLKPLKIKGLILHCLFIGGVERTDSEIRLANGGLLTLSLSDSMWAFSLPVGATRDHEYCNPLVGGGSDELHRIKNLRCPVMMAGRNGDLLIDRQMAFAKSLELNCVETKLFNGEGDHGIEYFDKAKAIELFEEISSFISSVNVIEDKLLVANDDNKDKMLVANNDNEDKSK